MNTPGVRDLGSGVVLSSLADGGVLVRSATVVLPWSARSGRVSGTAVLLDDRPFEVVLRTRGGGGDLWTLLPWPGNEAMRTVFTLDRGAVARLAAEATEQRRSGRRRVVSMALAPVLGAAPAGLQSSWARRWGFPAVGATVVSAVGELALATVGLMHVLSVSFGGAALLPGRVAWLGLVAPALAVEAVVRLKHAAATGEPIGTALLLPLTALASAEPSPASCDAPVVRHAGPGRLVVQSPIHRTDWVSGGVLLYRDEPYALAAVEREGRDWLYGFTAAGDDSSGPSLRLQPPRSRPRSSPVAAAPSIVRTTLVTALACMAPGDLQQTWARRIDAPAALLTLLGAGAECCGALINLAAKGPSMSSVSLLVNLFLLGEGAARLVMLAASSRPVGSLLGLAARSPLERWIKAA